MADDKVALIIVLAHFCSLTGSNFLLVKCVQVYAAVKAADSRHAGYILQLVSIGGIHGVSRNTGSIGVPARARAAMA